MPRMRLILASASPRRAELLRAAGYTFGVAAVSIDERVHGGEAAAAYVRRLAAEKSAAVAAQLAQLTQLGQLDTAGRTDSDQPDRIVILAADTSVVVGGEILGKPRDDADAERMLRRLSGRRHEVMTGVSVRHGAGELGRVEVTTVEFAPLDDADVAWYVASGEGRDKAGAYAIQGRASRFIPRIDGSYSNVVGLPVARVHELLASLESSQSR
jgi:septum formation protein